MTNRHESNPTRVLFFILMYGTEKTSATETPHGPRIEIVIVSFRIPTFRKLSSRCRRGVELNFRDKRTKKKQIESAKKKNFSAAINVGIRTILTS